MSPEAERLWRQHARRLLKTKTFTIGRGGKTSLGPCLPVDQRIIDIWQRNQLVEQVCDAQWRVTKLGNSSLLRLLGGTQAQHQILEVVRGKKNEKLTKNVGGSVIDWLMSRKTGPFCLSDAEKQAAKRFQAEYEQAHLMGRVTMNWDARLDGLKKRRTNASENLPQSVFDTRQRVHEALTYVGPVLSDMLVEACCANYSVQENETRFSLPARSGKVMLKLALARLAVFYNYQTSNDVATSFRIR